jgi:hypothetical protein
VCDSAYWTFQASFETHVLGNAVQKLFLQMKVRQQNSSFRSNLVVRCGGKWVIIIQVGHYTFSGE